MTREEKIWDVCHWIRNGAETIGYMALAGFDRESMRKELASLELVFHRLVSLLKVDADEIEEKFREIQRRIDENKN